MKQILALATLTFCLSNLVAQVGAAPSIVDLISDNPNYLDNVSLNAERDSLREGMWIFQSANHLLEEASELVEADQKVVPFSMFGNYMRGQQHGEWIKVGQSGKPAIVENYSYGIRNGSVLFINEAGDECYEIRLVRFERALVKDLQSDRKPLVISLPEYEAFYADWVKFH